MRRLVGATLENKAQVFIAEVEIINSVARLHTRLTYSLAHAPLFPLFTGVHHSVRAWGCPPLAAGEGVPDV